MLSKLYHFEKNHGNIDRAEINISALLGYYKKKGIGVINKSESEGGGTLGVVYRLSVNGQPKVVKTHLNTCEARNNLEKEYILFSRVFGDVVNTELVSINNRIYLIMDELSPLENEPKCGDISEFDRVCEDRLMNFSKNKFLNYDFKMVYDEAKKSLEFLNVKGFIKKSLLLKLVELFIVNETALLNAQLAVCHGDLSNKNILQTQKGQKVLIDWEDALIGIKEYDYWYWLTFFSSRKYYKENIFANSQYSKEEAKLLMIIIILIKSKISVLNDSYRTNSLSFSQRIEEILDI